MPTSADRRGKRKVAGKPGASRGRRTKTVVVTGATSGIGEAIALAFRDSGARVFLVGRNAGKIAATARRFPPRRLAGTRLADLANVADVHALLEAINSQLSRIDVLVLAAGEFAWTDLGTLDADRFDALFAVNVRAPYLLAKGLLPLLGQSNHGQIIVIGSSIVKSTGEGLAVYKATQNALQGLSDSLRQDFNGRGVRVTTLYPGRTHTPRMQRIYGRENADYDPHKLLQPEDLAALAVALTELPRGMEITDAHVRSVYRY